MRRVAFWAIAFLLLTHCSDEPGADDHKDSVVPNVTVRNGRLAFKDTKTYFATITSIDEMSEPEFLAWESSHPTNSLSKYFRSVSLDENSADHAEFRDFPNGYQAVLNSNQEVQIGDTLVWYNGGTKYLVPHADEELLREIRNDSSKAKIKLKYSLNYLTEKESQSENSGSRIYPEPGDGVVPNGYQYAFAYCYNGTQRKYVDELYTILDGVIAIPSPPGYTYHTYLKLRIKLEWLSSHGWKVAGEYRWINYDVTSSLRFWWLPPLNASPSTTTYFVTHYTGNSERNTDLNITLYETTSNYFYGDTFPYYDVELKGYIEQSITNAQPPVPGGTKCNTYRAPYAGANTASLLW